MTFDEWINYYADKDRTYMKSYVADKLKVKEYAKRYKVVTPKTLKEKPDGKYLLKANNDSGSTLIIDKTKIITGTVERFKKYRNKPYGLEKGEWWYKDIKRIEYMEEFLDDNIKDYKVHCHKGKAMFTQIIGDRKTKAKERIVFADGTPTGYLLHHTRTQTNDYMVPLNYKDIITTAEKLSKPFKYCRVDLYNHNNTIYLGEITFKPDGGKSKGPNQKELGELFNGND